MTDRTAPYPTHYVKAIRVLLRFALIMLVTGLLSGIAFQESAKKLKLATSPDELGFWDAALRLALVHGHIVVTAVLLPVTMACILHLARACGGAELTARSLRWTLRLYLPCVSVALCLMLYKGYHFLLAARRGATDLAEVNASLFGGITGLRHAVYGLSHVGMAVGLCIFAWCAWRSLRGNATT